MDEQERINKKVRNYLVGLREKAEMSQRDLCVKLGLDYGSLRTFVSQCENNAIRIPPARLKDWAKALGEPQEKFAKTMLKFYHPEFHEMLFRR